MLARIRLLESTTTTFGTAMVVTKIKIATTMSNSNSVKPRSGRRTLVMMPLLSNGLANSSTASKYS